MIAAAALRLMALWLAAAPAPALDQAPAEPPEVVRVEREGERAPTDLTGAVTILTSDRWEGRITSLAELLAEQTGVRIRSWGGLGSFATVSVRGSTADQVNLYLDGVRLNPASGGGVNLADFPLESLEAIEIYRGFAPAWLPGGAMGGAVNLRTRRAARAAADASLSWGSYGTGRLAMRAPLSSRGLLSFDGERSDGDFLFYDNNGTPATAADDGYERRANNAFWNGETAARLELPAGPKGRIDLSGSYLGRRAGVPGIDAFQSLDAVTSTSRALARAAWVREALELDWSATRTIQQFEDQTGDTTGGAASDTQSFLTATGPTARWRWRSPGSGPVVHELRGVIAGRLETAHQLDRLNPRRDRGRSSRQVGELSLEDELHLAGGRLVLSPSARLEWVADRFSSQVAAAGEEVSDRRLEPSGRLGLAWLSAPGLAVRASAGRFHRLPSFLEIFGDAGSVRGSGSDLEPETGVNLDAGIAWESLPAAARRPLRHLRIGATGFRTEADDLIQLILVSQNQVVAANTGRARITGLELSTALALFGWFDGGLEYTWQIARDRSDTFSSGSDLPGRPRHDLSAHAALTDPSGRWGRLSWSLDYLGPNWFDRASATVGLSSGLPRDQLRAPGRALHSFAWTRRFGRRIEAALEVDNAGDLHTVDIARYPLPGRLVSARVKVLFP